MKENQEPKSIFRNRKQVANKHTVNKQKENLEYLLTDLFVRYN